MLKIFIKNNETMHSAILQSGVKYETERIGVPSSLTFDVIKDDTIDFRKHLTIYYF